MKVFCLITVRSPEQFNACTLALQTIRRGFPTSGIRVFINGASIMQTEVVERCKYFGLDYHVQERSLFHADWLEEIITCHASRLLNLEGDDEFVICDGDCIFWESCEHMMPKDYYWKGHYIPAHLNEWSDTLSMERIHPSLVFGHAKQIMDTLSDIYPRAYQEDKEYCGWRPFHPTTVGVRGQLRFYDTLSVAFHSIGGRTFSGAEKDCYTHLNSASFYDTIIKRFDSDAVRQSFAKVHEIANTGGSGLDQLKGLWRNIDRYYDERAAMIQC